MTSPGVGFGTAGQSRPSLIPFGPSFRYNAGEKRLYLGLKTSCFYPNDCVNGISSAGVFGFFLESERFWGQIVASNFYVASDFSLAQPCGHALLGSNSCLSMPPSPSGVT